VTQLFVAILDSAQRVCGLEYQLNGAGQPLSRETYREIDLIAEVELDV
jgi:hypothetical protein